MSAVPALLSPPPGFALEHAWIAAARIDPRPRPGFPRGRTIRILPSDAGLEVLRHRGKDTLVAGLRALNPSLPAASRAWRIVDDLHDRSTDLNDWLNRPRIRSIERAADDAVHAVLWVTYDLRVFDGHFATVPLLPGVMQLAWAAELARANLGRVGRYRGVTAAKFRRLVRPGMELQLAASWSNAKREVSFEYRHAGSIVSGGRLRLSGAE